MLADALNRARSSGIVVVHQNTGSAPAVKLATDSGINFLSRRKINSGNDFIPWSLSVFPANPHCDIAKGKLVRQSLVETQTHIEILPLDPSLWEEWSTEAGSQGGTKSAFDAVRAGEATVYVQGCDLFETFSRDRTIENYSEQHTFCYYFNNELKPETYPLDLVKCPSSAE